MIAFRINQPTTVRFPSISSERFFSLPHDTKKKEIRFFSSYYFFRRRRFNGLFIRARRGNSAYYYTGYAVKSRKSGWTVFFFLSGARIHSSTTRSRRSQTVNHSCDVTILQTYFYFIFFLPTSFDYYKRDC